MSTRPEVLSVQREGDTARLSLHIPGDLMYFRGHFQQVPLLPGVVQVDWAIRLAQAQFALPPHFKKLSALKFMRVLSPGTQTELQLHWQRDRGELSFRYTSGDTIYSSGRIQFAGA